MYPSDGTAYVDIDALFTDSVTTSNTLSSNDREDDNERLTNQTAPFQIKDLHKIEKNVVQKGEKNMNTTPEVLENIESVKKEPRHTTQIWNLPKRFTINSLSRTGEEDEPTVREALTCSNAREWGTAMHKEFEILEDMKCWGKVNRPKYQTCSI